MVYAGGHISGGHYNPAVTLAVWLRGRSTAGTALAYMAVQIVAGIVAALIALFMKGNPAVSSTTLDPAPALVGEFLFTFALAFVVLNVATAKATEGNSYFGFAIGFTLVVAIYSLARFGAPSILRSPSASRSWALALGNLWIYLLATFLGGAAAALAFRGLHPSDG
jgi:aquaporin Z